MKTPRLHPRHRRPERNLFASLDTDAPHVTEVRRLLQALTRANRNGDRKSYMITSSGRGDGKSTICGLLGIVATRIFRKRTLIVDADLRRPTMHQLMGVPKGPGLFEAMHPGTPSPDIVPAPTPLPGLSVLPSGARFEPGADAYVDSRFQELLEGWRREYDLVLVDAPPVVPVIEPLLIAEHVDAILVVALAGHTPVTLLRRTKQVLEPFSAKIAGLVLNNASDRLPYYYEHRYYGYRSDEGRRSHEWPHGAPSKESSTGRTQT